MADAIRIEGLAQFNRAAKKLDAGIPKMVRAALNESGELLVDDSRPRVVRKTGKAAGSIRAASTQSAMRVRAGGSRAPWYPWLDFGGKVGRNRSVERPFYKHGRYIYKSYFELRDRGEFTDAMSGALLDVVRSAGLEVD